ncbi:MAG: XdhC family protein [Bacteroidota bacterium]|nr:XdhC family protein [Bacteroidota bacterium]
MNPESSSPPSSALGGLRRASILFDIYQEILSALEHEDSIMLATIISTSGSTPASALSKMIIKNGGTVSVGTIGGGCMEGDVILHANRLYQTGKVEVMSFHLNEDDIESGLICGGSLDVLIEPVSKTHQSLYQELKSLRDKGEDCVLASLFSGEGKIEWKQLIPCSPCSAIPLTSRIPHLTKDLEESIKKAHHRQETQRVELPFGELILEPITGTSSLIIFGGGHVSKFVSQTAAMAGFRVTVVDDREKYANANRFPEAVNTIVTDYNSAFENLNVTQSTYIVIVTRGHKYDEIVLEQAVKTTAKYIGMIGSKRKVLTTYEHLRERGVTDEMLNRVHAPIGLDISAVTAEEIAISIVAELIRVRRGENQPLQHKKESINLTDVTQRLF